LPFNAVFVFPVASSISPCVITTSKNLQTQLVGVGVNVGVGVGVSVLVGVGVGVSVLVGVGVGVVANSHSLQVSY
jgi:hypothetical protein